MNDFLSILFGRFINFTGSVKLIIWWFFNLSLSNFFKLFIFSSRSLFKCLVARSGLNILNSRQITQSRTTDKIFIFGSGFSINKITKKEWEKINKHDTFGFNGSFHLKKVNFKYHLIRAGYETFNGVINWYPYAEYAMKTIDKNKFMTNTLFLFPRGFTSSFTNNIIGNKMWIKNKPIYFFNTDRFSKYPHSNISHGLLQRSGTLFMAISFAIALKYKEIVLVGVDLYDNGYFWAPKGKTVNWSEKKNKEVFSTKTVRGIKSSDMHNTVNNGAVEDIKFLADYLKKSNVKLSTYNKKSLLAKVIETYFWEKD